MIDLSGDLYFWIKALHVICVMAWMAGLFYLPRLYVYHAEAEVGSELSETLKVMERRLLRAIMNPAMIASFVFGGLLLANLPAASWSDGWLHVKLLMVLVLAGMHGAMAKWRKVFLADANTKPHTYYRFMNEVPTVAMIVLVIMAVVKPF
ncbi:MAG: protoporphyrinogen oxidase HemJ [Rhodospirillales bacterium]